MDADWGSNALLIHNLIFDVERTINGLMPEQRHAA